MKISISELKRKLLRTVKPYTLRIILLYYNYL